MRSLGVARLDPAFLLATFFGAGLLPFAPGTFGSLALLPAAFLVREFAGRAGLALLCALLFAAGWWASSRIVRKSGEKDPQEIVIDEAAGQSLVLLALPQSLSSFVFAFLFFRFFDIVKPPPARWIERSLGGGLGVMLDDCVAAGYALGALFLLFAIGKAGGVLF